MVLDLFKTVVSFFFHQYLQITNRELDRKFTVLLLVMYNALSTFVFAHFGHFSFPLPVLSELLLIFHNINQVMV